MDEDKNYYATVSFSGKQADEQRKFLMAMTEIGVISLSKDEIESMYEADKKTPYGSTNNLVLHSEVEKKRFEAIMELFFKDTHYDIREEPEPEFAKWLKRNKEKEQKVNG